MNKKNNENKPYQHFSLSSEKEDWFEKLITNPISISVVVFIVMLGFVLFISKDYYGPRSFTENLLAEAHGVLIDILMLGVIIVWFQQKGNNKLLARRYQDEIDDFRNWKAEEAARRIRGNIKRMNEIGISAIDLNNCYLRNMDMRRYNLDGANMWRSDMSFCDLRNASMANSYMEDTNLYSSVLSNANFKNAVLWKADLKNADLRNTIFINAVMQESKLNESDLENSDLENANLTNVDLSGCNLFNVNLKGCDLEGAAFAGAYLKKANLRDSKGLTVNQLLKAQTLFETEMDEMLFIELININSSLFVNPEVNAEW